MKKFVSLVLCQALITTSVCAAFTDIENKAASEAAETLAVMKILDGMGNGIFAPKEYLTREQFAKITACILGQRNGAAANVSATAFTDVAPDNWARGYISYVAANGIIAGFPDGSFGGGQIITYAQGCAVLLRCLGYTDEEIGFHWPSDYVNKARGLKICEGLSLSANDPLSRENAAIMVYNALMTQTKDSVKLAEKSGFKLYEDITLFGLNSSDSQIVETEAGSFKIASSAQNIAESAGLRGTLFVNDNAEAVYFKDNGALRRSFTVVSAINNKEKGSVDLNCTSGSISIDADAQIYLRGTRTTAKDALEDFTSGSTLVAEYDENGKLLRATLTPYVMEGPKIITQGPEDIYKLFSAKETPTVIRKGVRADFDEIAVNDVVYYDAPSSTIYAYDNKVSGIYESASPTKNNPSAITLSGKEYKISSATAMKKLGETAEAFALDDYITLLLDRNGEICDVVDMQNSVGRNLAVVLDAYKRINSDGNQEYAVKLFLSDGVETEFAADKSYAECKGELMELSFNGAKASLKSITYSSRGGEINKDEKTFGDLWLTSDCSIIELIDLGDEVKVKKISFGDINGDSLNKSQVLHVETSGAMDDISLMYLRNATKTDYEYAIVVDTDVEIVEKRDENGNVVYEKKYTTGSYEVLLHGKETSVYAGRRVFANGVIGINADKNDFADSYILGSGKQITAISGNRIRVDSKIYKIGNDFDIYRCTNTGKFYLVSWDEALKLKGTVTLYGDNKAENGGLARLAIVREA